jgi:flagellar protein FliO/FliZ
MKSLTLTRGAALTGALMLTHASVALAASGGESTPLHLTSSGATHAASNGGGSSIVRTIVGLFIVIAVIYGVAWILRQAKGAKRRPTGRGLHQMASLPLGSGRSVTLVRAGSEVVLLGVADHGVTPIKTYTEEEALELGLEVPEEEPYGAVPAERSLGRVANTLRRMTVRS